jgi:hypothetical protein
MWRKALSLGRGVSDWNSKSPRRAYTRASANARAATYTRASAIL